MKKPDAHLRTKSIALLTLTTLLYSLALPMRTTFSAPATTPAVKITPAAKTQSKDMEKLESTFVSIPQSKKQSKSCLAAKTNSR